jgi:hypothetical protein
MMGLLLSILAGFGAILFAIWDKDRQQKRTKRIQEFIESRDIKFKMLIPKSSARQEVQVQE